MNRGVRPSGLVLVVVAACLAASSAGAAPLISGLGGPAGYGTGTVSFNDDGYSEVIDLRAAFPAGLNFFNEKMSSFGWCGVAGATMTLYDNSNFDTGGEGYLSCEGDGLVRRTGNVGTTLPSGCTNVIVNGMSHYQCGSVYYLPQYSGSSVTYTVVTP